MSDPVVNVENLSKRYVLSHRGRSEGLRHTLEEAVRHPWSWLSRRSSVRSRTAEEFWALKDVSFSINKGEVIGVVGRNGAGKSTLLKILSRITEPTTGRVSIEGRVASLLEVGTGFHQELTGRENIFLNGSILGMTRREIRRKFDEIVSFAEVERFLDTPVKRYSSGMYVRLAFSVAAHLDPEILIIDEVLAVGDSEFQKKCLGKVEDVASSQGRTVLFVSHNMGVINRLCRRSILLEQGRLKMAGATSEVIAAYLQGGAGSDGLRVWDATEKASKDPRLTLLALRVLDTDGKPTSRLDVRNAFSVELEYQINAAMPRFRVALRFVTADGTLAFTTSDSSEADYEQKPTGPGRYRTRCAVYGNLLNEGSYSVTLTGDIPFQQVLFNEECALRFVVEQTGGVSSRFTEQWPGAVCPRLHWEVAKQDAPPLSDVGELVSSTVR